MKWDWHFFKRQYNGSAPELGQRTLVEGIIKKVVSTVLPPRIEFADRWEKPLLGALISLSKRVDLNLNTFWMIPIAKAEGILEQPFSVGLNFQL